MLQYRLLREPPIQVRQRLAGRLNDHMETIILENGGVGLRRKSGKAWKKKHQVDDPKETEDYEQEDAKKKTPKARVVARGAMLRHTRNQKRMYLGKEARKYLRARYFQARLARADEELQRETLPPLQETVWIKRNKKTGRPGYVRYDPRRKRSLRTIRQMLRSLVPLDESIVIQVLEFSFILMF